MEHASQRYYVPHGTNWPILGSIGLFLMLGGASIMLNGASLGSWVTAAGAVVLLVMLFGWFGTVIGESEKGTFNAQVDASFRMGMLWFIFSEVMFFMAFFGALFYTRVLSVPWLGGEGSNFFTGLLLWSPFESQWPTNGPADVGGSFEAMSPFGLPAVNTLILLTSGITITLAHHGLKAGHRGALIVWLAATWALGFLFLGFQAEEYIHAYQELNLRLDSGIYGSTFFMLTGFHGLHVTLGATMLLVIWFRCLRGHFTPTKHFAFEAVAWYWHFVDVVWLGLFIFVYWL
jgi:cytochrome c oxidase subunit 3